MEILRYDSLSSTNAVLLEMSKKSAKSWTAIWTSDQTQGKGYAGNVWTSEKNKNIAVSLLIINNLNYSELIYFNEWVCNCICELLENYSNEVFVKWPNDIIIKNKKVCGVLIETYKSDNQMNIIIGIGLNVNQEDYSHLPKAGSIFTQTGNKLDLEEILSDLLTKLESSYDFIQNKDWNSIIETYNSNLFRKNKVSAFQSENQIFNGIIQEVNELGLLKVKLENNEFKEFKHKEIELLY